MPKIVRPWYYCNGGCQTALFLTLFLMPAEMLTPNGGMQATLSAGIMFVGALLRAVVAWVVSAGTWLLLHITRHWTTYLLRGLLRFVRTKLMNGSLRYYVFLHPTLTMSKLLQRKQRAIDTTMEYLNVVPCRKCFILLGGTAAAVAGVLVMWLWIIPMRLVTKLVDMALEWLSQTGWGRATAQWWVAQEHMLARFGGRWHASWMVLRGRHRRKRRRFHRNVACLYRRIFHPSRRCRKHRTRN